MDVDDNNDFDNIIASTDDLHHRAGTAAPHHSITLLNKSTTTLVAGLYPTDILLVTKGVGDPFAPLPPWMLPTYASAELFHANFIFACGECKG